jgi:hypothetical protein
MEYKLILHNGRLLAINSTGNPASNLTEIIIFTIGAFHHLSRNHVSSGRRLAFSQGVDLGTTAETFLNELVAAYPGTIVSGVVRVDIMIHNARIVVNEFESLEAFYSTSSSRPRELMEEYETYQFMQSYWIDMLQERVIRQEVC